MSKRSKKRRLRPRERRILHLANSGIATVEILHRAFFADADVEAVRSALRRLVQRGMLRAEPLDAKRVYYRLTRRGSRRINPSSACPKALKKQGRVQRYAVSWFIHADCPGKRALVNPFDYPDQFPVTEHRLPRHPFFLDRSDGRLRFGVILIDHNAHYRRMSYKTVMLLGRFLRHGWFDTFIRQDAFVVAILTFSEHRMRTFTRHVPHAIAEQLSYPLSQLRPDLDGAIPQIVRVHVIPQLDAVVGQSERSEAS
jgi:hypothetical protein